MANGTIIELEDEECTQEKPPEEEPCESETSCQASDWIATEWSGCEDTCGKIFHSNQRQGLGRKPEPISGATLLRKNMTEDFSPKAVV